MLTFCSIATEETVPQARVLAGALARTHPDARVVIVLPGAPAAAEPFEPLSASELAEAGAAQLAAAGDPQRAAARLCPFLLRHALAEGAEVAVYVAPEVCSYDAFDPALELVRERGVVLTRRLSALPDDDKHPDHADLLIAGRISPAFVAVARGPDGERFLDWWMRRVHEQDGVPARWLDLAPDLFDVALLEDPGCNVSYWNLHERPLTRSGEQVLASGHLLRFMDFTGLRPDRPYWLSDSATRVRVVDEPVLAELCGDYAKQVRDAGWAPAQVGIDTTDRLGNGLRFDEVMRALWREEVMAEDRFKDLSSPLVAEEFVSWLREPTRPGGAAGVNRYLLGAYRLRPKLHEVFPDPDGADGAGLVAWAWEHGRRELELVSELLPPPPEGMDLTEDAHLAVNVIGFLDDTLGLGEAARLYVSALRTAGVPVTTTAISAEDAAGQSGLKRYGSGRHRELQTSVEPVFNLACMNGDHLDVLIRKRGEELLAGRPTIGQWGWETDVLPPSWLPAFGHVEEVWVYSTFVAQNLGRLSPVPVVVIPQAVVTPDPSGVELDIAADDRFTFLFMFDFFSTLRRKNPAGVIDAFTRAFRPGEGPRLLLKTINGRFRGDALDELRGRIGDRPDIELIDVYLEPGQHAALLSRADCYVSLHRSEGFGLTLAESMALGTPVIATGYSGNTDFTTPQNSYLVDWDPTRVGPGNEIYPAEGTWAEPDLDHAAELMRRVWEQPQEAQVKSARARADIERGYAPQVVGRLARARLERLAARQPGVSPSSPEPRVGVVSSSLSVIERQLALDVRRGAPPMPRGLTGLIRRVMLRLIAPFTVHERNLDRAIADVLGSLSADLERERALRTRDSARLNRLERRLKELDER